VVALAVVAVAVVAVAVVAVVAVAHRVTVTGRREEVIVSSHRRQGVVGMILTRLKDNQQYQPWKSHLNQ
jgi:hypothetical protein